MPAWKVFLLEMAQGGKSKSQAVEQDIKSATDDEIFDFINKKLGRA